MIASTGIRRLGTHRHVPTSSDHDDAAPTLRGVACGTEIANNAV